MIGLTQTALGTALLVLSALIAVPAPLPFTLQSLAVCLLTALIGAERAAIAYTAYLFLGAIGLPVFAGMQGGFGVLAGPTGGYLLSFLLAIPVMGAFFRLTSSLGGRMIGTLLGHAVLYLGGTLYYTLVYAPEAGFWGGLALCVLPYLLPDAAKATLALLLASRLSRLPYFQQTTLSKRGKKPMAYQNLLQNEELFRALVLGAERIEMSEDGVHLFRFTEEERSYYNDNPGGRLKALATSGVRLSFVTDSRRLSLTVHTETASTRKYMAVDILVNGVRVGNLQNFSEDGRAIDPDGKDLGEAYFPFGEFAHGEFSAEVDLGEGEKQVTVHMPCLSKAVLCSLLVDEGATVRPDRPAYRHLIYGDSITQGYDGRHPSATYTAQLSDFFSAEGFNKAIGGEEFCPALAELAVSRRYDFVTVAYGTNDWSHASCTKFEKNAAAFLAVLAARYPEAKIFVITPIWRGDMDDALKIAEAEGSLWDYAEFLAKECEKYPNMFAIRGDHLVPPDQTLFADLRLHPNDEGYAHYFEGLKAAISPLL